MYVCVTVFLCVCVSLTAVLAAGTSMGKVAFYKYYRVEKDEEHNWHVQYVATVSGPAKMCRSVPRQRSEVQVRLSEAKVSRSEVTSWSLGGGEELLKLTLRSQGIYASIRFVTTNTMVPMLLPKYLCLCLVPILHL